jgi:hypothetical protein
MPGCEHASTVLIADWNSHTKNAKVTKIEISSFVSLATLV